MCPPLLDEKTEAWEPVIHVKNLLSCDALRPVESGHVSEQWELAFLGSGQPGLGSRGQGCLWPA